MAEVGFERFPRSYKPEQRKVMTEMFRTHAPYDDGKIIGDYGRIRGESGTMRIIDEWGLKSEDPYSFLPKIVFSLKFLGLDSEKYFVRKGIRITEKNNWFIARREDARAEKTIYPDDVRLIDKIYSGIFEVGDLGWVIINIRDPKTGKYSMSDKKYEEMVAGAYQGKDPRFYVDEPCVQVPPDYKKAVATVVLFDPLIDSLRNKYEIDGVVFDQDGKLIPSRILRLLSPDIWQTSS